MKAYQKAKKQGKSGIKAIAAVAGGIAVGAVFGKVTKALTATKTVAKVAQKVFKSKTVKKLETKIVNKIYTGAPKKLTASATKTLKKPPASGITGGSQATFSELKQVAQFLKRSGLDSSQRREVIEAFNPGAQVVKLDKDLVVYRYSGGAANPKGRWLTTKPLDDPINQLALPPGSTASNMTKWTIPKDTEVFRGTAAPNFGRAGGAPQIYLPNPNILN